MQGNYRVINDTLCPVRGAVPSALLAVTLLVSTSAHASPPANDFPTLARVEYVQECINRTGGKQAHIYQCVCVVDRIADEMTYDEFVEATTFARYSTLPGEIGGIFRDPSEAKSKAKRYREIEAHAFSACNLSESSL